jgi:RNA polymerase-binding transcription factor DksA
MQVKLRSPVRFHPATLVKLRRDLLRRGETIATLLAEVLAGKHPPGAQALLAQKPGMRPDEALRLALDQVEGRRRLIDAGDDRYGRCDICGADLGAAALGEMPWADRCAAHATA